MADEFMGRFTIVEFPMLSQLGQPVLASYPAPGAVKC